MCMPVAWMMQHVVFVYLANTVVLCYSLTIICCCQVQNYIYWIISTENDHRHHHKFIKYEKRLRKVGNASAYLSSNIFATSVWVWKRSTSFSSFHRPTDPLHISCICSIWKILHFYSSFSLNPSKSAFFHALTLSLLPKNHMLFIVSKQCACWRRVNIEGHTNRVGLNWIFVIMDNNSDSNSFGPFAV
jgi:hypothetical protein